MATLQDLGKVAYFNKGAYNSETSYEINDVVSYNGSSYVSKVNENVGNLPTEDTYWDIVALKGEKGDTGKAFVIEKVYTDIASMVADYDNMNVGDYVMISGNIEDEENATLWTKTETEDPTYKWVYLADFSGASGITGATPNIQIGNVTEGNQPSVTRRAGSSNENPILDFVLKTGATGATGATGNGIASITKTATVGLVDTYTITYTNGTTTSFEVTNGQDGEITQEDLDETVEMLQAEDKSMRDDFNNATLTISGNGEDIELENTIDGRFKKFEVEGNSKQNTTTGKNLLNTSSLSSYTENGITFTPVYDGDKLQYIEANGTATANAFYASNKITHTFIGGESYILNGCPAGGGSTTYALYYGLQSSNADTGSGITISLAETTTYQIALLIRNGYTANKLRFYPMVRLASVTDGTYEPYTGAKPSPNADYEQPILSAGDNGSITEKIADNSIVPQEQTYTIPCQQPMRSLETVRDKFVKVNGVWKERHNVERYIFTGEETITLQSINSNNIANFNYQTGKSNYFINGNVLCNMLQIQTSGISSTNSEGIYMNWGNEIYIRRLSSEADTVEELITWLSTNYANNTPLYIDYPLNTPTDLTCTAEQITVLEALEKAKSYEGTTNIYSTDDISAYIEVEALGKVENGKSAYEIWLDNGNTGTEQQFLDSLKPVKGTDYWTSQDKAQIVNDVISSNEISAIATTASTAKSIAEGANQALSYANYSAMVTAFNSLASTVYKVGQNVMIVTLEVPDLWISSIESTSSTYTYTTDSAITEALETNGYIQVGYYRLSALETQKVDLTDYALKSQFVTLTQAQYDALVTKDVNTYYFIVEE